MKRLTIKFKDGSQVKYTMKNNVDHIEKFKRHSIGMMESAMLQQYPKKDNESIDMLKEFRE
ncbi:MULTISPECIES: hypothetical protein [Clostridium]|uniref:hypothetical protein n=1 Tax=Clostridium TaxID=1485 RepID=UPI00266EAE8B|nr:MULTISPECIES: hypothetical protein [Clostridium]MDU6296833.1 hypothetical protein [Clostridium celatum]